MSLIIHVFAKINIYICKYYHNYFEIFYYQISCLQDLRIWNFSIEGKSTFIIWRCQKKSYKSIYKKET